MPVLCFTKSKVKQVMHEHDLNCKLLICKLQQEDTRVGLGKKGRLRRCMPMLTDTWDKRAKIGQHERTSKIVQQMVTMTHLAPPAMIVSPISQLSIPCIVS